MILIGNLPLRSSESRCVAPRAQKVINLLSITNSTHCRLPEHFSLERKFLCIFFLEHGSGELPMTYWSI